MTTLLELETELATITQQITYAYENRHVKTLEIQTAHGRTLITHNNFNDVLKDLKTRKAEIEAEIAALNGGSNSIVDLTAPALAVPLVYRGI